MLIIVLFRDTTAEWVLGDFFLACECDRDSSGHSTPYSRGTAGYRPPELLKEDMPRFTSKVDIWSLGCVMYELCTGKRAFESDFSIFMSAQNPPLHLVIHMEGAEERTNARLQTILQAMLEFNPSKRPTAESLVITFEECLGRGISTLGIKVI